MPSSRRIPIYTKTMELTLMPESIEQLELVAGKARSQEIRRWIHEDLKHISQSFIPRLKRENLAKVMIRVDSTQWDELRRKATELYTFPATLVRQIVEARLKAAPTQTNIFQ